MKYILCMKLLNFFTAFCERKPFVALQRRFELYRHSRNIHGQWVRLLRGVERTHKHCYHTKYKFDQPHWIIGLSRRKILKFLISLISTP